MGYVKVYTQEDLDRVLREGVDVPEIRGDGRFTAYDSAQVTASGSAQVTASGSAQVTAYDSAQVTASGSAQVRAYDSAQVRAAKLVAVSVHGSGVKLTGGVRIDITPAASPEEWAEIHLAEPHEDGAIVLYKAVRDDYRSAREFAYAPGSVPVAPDWDGGKVECGGGLHFCASPFEALGFDSQATRFMACPVALSDLAVVPNPDMPNKIKARGCCAPIWEVDIDGKPVAGEGE